MIDLSAWFGEKFKNNCLLWKSLDWKSLDKKKIKKKLRTI
jgi:hypothetical protein